MPDNRIGRDDFWDIADLIPTKRARPSSTPSRTSTDPVEIRVAAPAAHGDARDLPLTVEINPAPRGVEAKPLPDEVYTPSDSLVREVRIFHRKREEQYYEAFHRTARELYGVSGVEVSAVDFFSYMPQYGQMNKEQLAFYLWWRECFQNGTPIDAPFSYLLLYLYEQINLGDVQEPRAGQENILRLWLTYRTKHPRIEALAREWLCDYSLLYRLPPPALSIGTCREALSGFRLKEFYIPARQGNEQLVHAVLLFCNNYDYTKSKFYRPDTKDDFDRVLGGAVRVALDFLREEGGGLLTGKNGISTMTREAFAGAICIPRLKARIEVEYTSFSNTHDLRYIITDVLKYAENALRATFGVRSRLSVYAVSAPLRERLDAYLRGALPEKRPRSVPKKEMPQYERRYDLPAREISTANAAAIEEASWQTTRRLVEAFAPETGEETLCAVSSTLPAAEADAGALSVLRTEPEKDENIPANGSDFANALGDYLGFVALAAARDRAGQRAFAQKKGEMPDAIADKINTVAGDFVGDIILEDCGGFFAVVEDYLELLTEEGVL